MKQKLILIVQLAALVALFVLIALLPSGPGAIASSAAHADALTAQAAVGRKMFFDSRLSNPQGMSCATCHDPRQGWGGNNAATGGVAAGALPGARGIRNTPTIGYAGYIPAFRLKNFRGETLGVGGLFWDGRANTLEEQARGPLFGKAEMNLADDAELAARLRLAPYAAELRAAFSLPDHADDVQWVTAAISGLAAFERSPEVAPFSSKYDAWLRGQTPLSDAEARGLKLFADRKKANCIACHVIDPASKASVDHLFTNFSYVNLGLPRNAAIDENKDSHWFDLGLCGPARKRPQGSFIACGAFKVPTLRNVAKRPFLFHNGGFTRLDEAVRFYVERNTHPERWYSRSDDGKLAKFDDLPQRYTGNVRHGEPPYDTKIGKKPHLSGTEIADVIAFLKTLDDGFQP